MKVIDQDLFEVESGIICQAVNCQGVMGSGVALAVKQRWPRFYQFYAETCALRKDNPASLLGTIDRKSGILGIPEGLHVVNMFTQVDYNRRGQNERHTNYGAVATCFASIREQRSMFGPVYIPYKMCCDRGGADFEIFTEIVDQVCPGVIACRIPR